MRSRPPPVNVFLTFASKRVLCVGAYGYCDGAVVVAWRKPSQPDEGRWNWRRRWPGMAVGGEGGQCFECSSCPEWGQAWYRPLR